MKVCILSSVHSCFDTRVFHKEAKSLVKAGYQVTLVGIAPFRHKVVEEVSVWGLQRPKTRLLRPLNWYRILRIALAEKPDIYHFHDPELLPLGWFLQQTTGKPVVYDCHEHYADSILAKTWIHPRFRRLLSQLVEVVEPRISGSLSAVIGVTETQLSIFPKAVILYNFPARILFEPLSSTASKSRDLVYVGRLSEPRGVFLMLEALSLLNSRKVQLFLAGAFDNSDTKRQVERSIHTKGLEQMVHLAGTIPYDQVPSYLARSKVGLVPLQPIPQYNNAIPTKMFEYMACGLPVVASDLPPIRRFIGSLDCGFLVQPGSPEAFAEAILYLLDHPEQAQQMGHNGRAAFLEQYNWESAEEKKLLTLYDGLLDTG